MTSSESLIHGFNSLRSEQRQLSSKVSELETDVTEHKLVCEALSHVSDKNRKCFRMIGGVLVERTVEEVLPQLEKNRQMIETLIESLNKQIVTKGEEIAKYIEKHNIQIRSQSNSESNSNSNSVSETNSLLVQ